MSFPTSQRAITPTGNAARIPSAIFESRDPSSTDVGPPWPIQQKWVNTTTQAIWVLESFSTSSGVISAQWRALAPIVTSTSAPTSSDYQYPVGQIWMDTATSLAWILTAVSGSTATWENFAGSGIGVDSFTVPAGTSPVVPDSDGTIDLPAGNGFAFTGGTNAMTGAMTSPFTGSFTFNQTAAGTAEVIAVAHSDNTAAQASSARVNVAVGGTTQIGDPYIQFATGSSRVYSLGSDTSDSQILKINTDAAANVSPSSGTNIWLLDSSSNLSTNTISLGHSPPEIDISFTINGAALNGILSIDTEGATDLGGIIDHRHSDTAGFGGHQIFLRSRGTHASPTVVQSGDVLGRIVGAGYDGTDYAEAGEIRSEVDGTPGSNDMPGRWVFLVSPDGSQTPAEALRISQNKLSTFSGDVTIETGTATVSTILTISNTDNTSALSDARTRLEVGGTSAGSAMTIYSVPSTTQWTVGLDNGDDDSYKIAQSDGGLATNTAFKIFTSGEIIKPLQPAFLGFLGTAVTNATGNGTTYILGDTDIGAALTEVFDQNSDFSPGSAAGAIFTAPVTGRYFLQARYTAGDATIATTFNIQIQTSNALYPQTFVKAAGSQDESTEINVVCDMDAMDTAFVNIIVTGEAGDTITIENTDRTTMFAGYLIC